MRKTSFNAALWGLTTFHEIGYDKEQNILYIYLHNGEILEFYEIEEKDVFTFILEVNKETLIKQFQKKFPYLRRKNIPV